MMNFPQNIEKSLKPIQKMESKMQVIIFEGQDEIIIGLKKDGKKLKQLWFTEGARNIEWYDISTCEITNGIAISSKVDLKTDCIQKDYVIK